MGRARTRGSSSSSSSSSKAVATLPPCKYGIACYQKDARHAEQYSHPCPYGPKCYRRNPVHMVQFTHDDSDDSASASDSDSDDAAPATSHKSKKRAKGKRSSSSASSSSSSSRSRTKKAKKAAPKVDMDGLNVVFTGTFDRGTRKVCEAEARRYGAIPMAAVSKNTDILVIGGLVRPYGAKEDRAKALGVKVIFESAWEKIIEENKAAAPASSSDTSSESESESDSRSLKKSTKTKKVAATTPAAADNSDSDGSSDDANLDIDGMKVVFTGTFMSGARKAVEGAAEDLGAVVLSSVSSRTDLLVVGGAVRPYGAKETKAKALGVKIIFEDEWLKLVAKAQGDDDDENDDDENDDDENDDDDDADDNDDDALASLPKPKNSLDDGESVDFKASSGRTYKLKRTGDHYYCVCPAWRNQSAPVNARTCKHLAEFLGEEYEKARVGHVKAAPLRKRTDPKPRVLLAHKWEGTKDVSGWLMSEKLDGVRALWNGKVLMSRLGNPFPAPTWFTKALPTDMHLDGELFIGRGKFNETVSVVKTSGTPKWKKVTYQLFDSNCDDDEATFDNRFDALTEWHKEIVASSSSSSSSSSSATASIEHIVIVEHSKIRDNKHVEDELKHVTEVLGGEGLMLRSPAGLYVDSRSDKLLKVKVFHDAEAEVIAHQEGKGRHKGRMGALVSKMQCGKTFKIGTGFTDAQREKPPKIGAIVTYKFQELTPDGIPRFPVFVGERFDMDGPKDYIPKKLKKTTKK